MPYHQPLAMNILAIDQATKTGWATASGSGVWDFKIKRDESAGMRLIRFKAKLREMIDIAQIDLVVYERVAGRHRGAIIVSAELSSVLKTYCEEKSIEYRAYSAGEIKRHATGKGNSGKPLMLSSAKEKWPDKIIADDNEADALWLHDLAMSDYG